METAKRVIDDRPVFVADRPWRQRAANAGLSVSAVFLVGWLIAIVAGAIGFGTLPPLPFAGGGNESGTELRSGPAGATSLQGPRSGDAGGSPLLARPQQGAATQRAAASSGGRRGGAGRGTSGDLADLRRTHAVPRQPNSTATSPISPHGGRDAAPPPVASTLASSGNASGAAPAAERAPNRSAEAPATTPSGNAVPAPQGGSSAVAGDSGVGKARHETTG